jgi:bifunctional N-acetylglucosamine-1-phosphate-uridyltransferase/glucosamine-1-phosphate-acetyltransferase GlmU-like protein
MANTITQLSYANTFGDWVVTTNQAANELNGLGFGNWTKNEGLMSINGSGLQVANNTTLSSNVYITGPGTSLQVSHDAVISGNLTVQGNMNIALDEIVMDEIIGNSVVANTGTIISFSSSNATFTGVTAGNTTINYDLSVGRNVHIVGDLQVDGNTSISLNEIVGANFVTDDLVANTANIVNETVSGTLVVNAFEGTANDAIYQTINNSQLEAINASLAISIALG